MIEQGIYFALGCFLTALAALLFAPVFWHRALRLTRQRLQLQIPLSMQEIIAERDELRAAFAVDQARLEQELEQTQAKADALLADCGRRTVELERVTEAATATKAELAALQTRLDSLDRDGVATATALMEAQTALKQVTEDRDGWKERTAAGLTQQDRLNREIESQRTTIAGLETAKAGLELRVADAARAFAREEENARTLKTRLETAMSQATRHEAAGLSLRRELDDAQAGRRQLESELAATRTSAREAKRTHEQELAGLREVVTDRDKINGLLRRERDDVRVQLAKAENELASVRSDLAAREARIVDLEGRLTAEAEHQASQAALRRELQEAYGRVRTLEAQAMELAGARTELSSAQSRLGSVEKQLSILEKARSDLQAERTALHGERARLSEELEAVRAQLASVEGALPARDRMEADLQAELAALRTERSALSRDLAELRSRQADLEAGGSQLRGERGDLQARLDKAVMDLARHEAEVAALRSAGQDLRARVVTAEAAAGEARERERASQLARGLLTDKARRGERLLAEQVKALIAENATLQAKLDAAVANLGATPAAPSLAGPLPPTDADLRQSIHALGTAVADLSRQMGAEAPNKVPPTRRRKPGAAQRSVGAV